jgi:hypothetical protein
VRFGAWAGCGTLAREQLGHGPGEGGWMTFGERVLGAMQLDARAFDDVEHDPGAMGQSIGVIALAAISAGIGNLWYGGISGIFTGVLIALVGYLVWALIVWLVGTKVMPDPQTSADFPETFRVIAFAAAPGLFGFITFIPILGWLLMFVIWLWTIAAMVIAVRTVLDYTSTGKAVGVVLIGFFVNMMVTMMMGALLFGSAMLREMVR